MKLCSGCGKQFELSGWRCPFCLHEPERLDGLLAFAPKLAGESEGFEANYFSSLVTLEEGNFWFRSRNRLIIWALRRYFPRAESFMEIGCGTGYVLSGIREAFPELALFGSEIFTAGLCFAAGRLPGVELFQMNARDIPFREEFDVVGAFDVLEHIKEDEEVLAQMYQATRKSGGIILTVPQHAFLWSQTDEYARHVRRYNARDLKEKCERAGFTVVRMTSFVSLLLPLLMLSRAKQQLLREKVEDASEFKISPLMNATLERALDAERAAIRSGLSLPAGGSLLLVARRD
jgi:SAM-dependent methyltransferase